LAESDTVVVQTDLEAGAVRDWGIPDSRILKLGMAVEHAEVTGGHRDRFRGELAIPEHARVIGHLATLDLNKGTNDLVLATERLNRSRPAHDPIYLMLAGPSSPDFERFLVELPTASWPWLKRLGPLPLADRPDFFASIDVFSMPSRTDSFGIVFLEAWANARPVVAAAAGGVPDVVRHGEAGLLAPFGDLDRLSDALGGLIDHPDRARALGAVGRTLVDRGHTWEDRFATLEGRARELMTGRRSRFGSAG
jgi:glycosyltransferase involved in cell wall biosynthesis